MLAKPDLKSDPHSESFLYPHQKNINNRIQQELYYEFVTIVCPIVVIQITIL